MSIQTDVLELFNCLMLTGQQRVTCLSYELVEKGIVLDFTGPDAAQRAALNAVLKPLRLHTLFSRKERETADVHDLLVKQILHYIEVYGLDMPGLFDLTFDGGAVLSMRYVSGITPQELEAKVQALLYANAPVKDAVQLQRVIDHYALNYDLTKVKNNELRVLLWRPGMPAFTSGDDAVRWLCARATGKALLIKSREVIKAVGDTSFPRDFFVQHEEILAQVFNRHKPLILAAKRRELTDIINRISRRSKRDHVPLHEAVAKTFVHHALLGKVGGQALDRAHVTVRDKLKFLNALAEKRLQRTLGLFRVRNGKVWYRDDMRTYDLAAIDRVERMVLHSLSWDLAHLRDKRILLDGAVDYGLPTSRKQTLGRLPYGTQVSAAPAEEISAGMYWENAWGARDLDLSAVQLDGRRVGWGGIAGYNARDIVFSGDQTDATNGAMEFMTSGGADYGLIVNIFCGDAKGGADMELVVGTRSQERRRWIDDVLVRERHKLESRDCLLGFVKGRTFTVWGGRLSNRIISGVNPALRAMEADTWTVGTLLQELGIDFDLDAVPGVVYDHDLSYEAFSYDKLESLFETTA